MKNSILFHYAAKNTAYLHGAGKAGTDLLFSKLDIRPGMKVLEIGFGTGASLVKFSSHYPDIILYGLERNEFMLHKAQQRLRFSLIHNVDLQLVKNQEYPYGNNFFDLVYIESVLAILPLEQIKAILQEIGRILKPGGTLAINETLWLRDVSADEIHKINDACLHHYGIIQSNADLSDVDAWKELIEQKGYFIQEVEKVSPPFQHATKNWKETLSAIYSLWGSLRARFNSQLNKQEKAIEKLHYEIFEKGRSYMNSYIILAKR